MKKILSYLSLAITGLLMAACSEDFKDWLDQQTYPQEDAITIPGFTATAVGNIDLKNVDEVTSLLTLSEAALPEGYTIQSLRLDVTPAEGGETVQLTADADGNFAKADLQALVEQAYGKRPVNRVFNAHVYASAVKDGVAALIDAGTIQLNITPEAPQISENYYIVGGASGDWAGTAASKELKFNHSGADVYEDPEFSIVIDAAEGDTWFAIGDDEALDAITYDNNWSKLFGIVGGDNEAKTGKLERRYIMGEGVENSFKVAAGAKKIKVVINMMDYTFSVEPVTISDSYYLIGGALDWAASAASKEQKFSHSDADVFEDPVFTYVFAGNGGTGDIWFAFGDDETCEAIGNNDWTKLYGYKGELAASGSFDRRYNLGDGVENSFHVDGSAKFYRFQINMAEMTYTITPLDFSEYFYEIGNESGWSTSHVLYGPAGDGKYQGYYYLNGEFKFKPNADNWENDLEFVAGTPTEGTLTPDGGPNVGDPGAGFYRIDLDAASLSYKLTKIDNVSIIGTANGNWDTDTDLTYNVEEGCWEVTTTLNAGEMKFRGNHNWNGDVDLGGSFDNLVHGGSNIAVEAGTYNIKLYISYAGNHRAVVTKQ